MTTTTNNALMRKTKAQLVDIILRKDDVHRENLEKIRKCNDEVLKAKNHLKTAMDQVNEMSKEVDKFVLKNKELSDVICNNAAELKVAKEELQAYVEANKNANGIINDLRDEIDNMTSIIAEKNAKIHKIQGANIIYLIITIIVFVVMSLKL